MSVYHDCKECMYHESVPCMSLLAPLQYSGTTAVQWHHCGTVAPHDGGHVQKQYK